MWLPLLVKRVDWPNDCVPDFAGGGGSAVIQSPIEHEPATNTTTQVQIEQMLDVAPDPKGRLGERNQVSIVVEQRDGSKGLFDSIFERELLPARHSVREMDDAAPRVNWPSKPHTNAHEPIGLNT